MASDFHRPGPDGVVQLRAAGKHCGMIDELSGMEIDRNNQILDALPERKVHIGVKIVSVGLAVDERAFESKLFDGTLQFRGGGVGILQVGIVQ